MPVLAFCLVLAVLIAVAAWRVQRRQRRSTASADARDVARAEREADIARQRNGGRGVDFGSVGMGSGDSGG